MRRPCWQQLQRVDGELVPLRLDRTPLNQMAHNPCLVGAVINQTAERASISIYRVDPKDAPTPINVDNYSVYDGLPPHLDVNEMIKTAATETNPNFEHYAENHVFIIKDTLGNDHWLDQLPPEVAILIEEANTPSN